MRQDLARAMKIYILKRKKIEQELKEPLSLAWHLCTIFLIVRATSFLRIQGWKVLCFFTRREKQPTFFHVHPKFSVIIFQEWIENSDSTRNTQSTSSDEFRMLVMKWWWSLKSDGYNPIFRYAEDVSKLTKNFKQLLQLDINSKSQEIILSFTQTTRLKVSSGAF